MERFDFVNRANADYIDRLYEQYQRDPRSIDLTWQAYFAGFDYAAGRNGKLSARSAPTPGGNEPARGATGATDDLPTLGRSTTPGVISGAVTMKMISRTSITSM